MRFAFVAFVVLAGAVDAAFASCVASVDRTINGKFEIISVERPQLQCFKDPKKREGHYEEKLPGCLIEAKSLGEAEPNGDKSFKFFMSEKDCTYKVGEVRTLTLKGIGGACCLHGESRRWKTQFAVCDDIRDNKINDSFSLQCFRSTYKIEPSK